METYAALMCGKCHISLTRHNYHLELNSLWQAHNHTWNEVNTAENSEHSDPKRRPCHLMEPLTQMVLIIRVCETLKSQPATAIMTPTAREYSVMEK